MLILVKQTTANNLLYFLVIVIVVFKNFLNSTFTCTSNARLAPELQYVPNFWYKFIYKRVYKFYIKAYLNLGSF